MTLIAAAVLIIVLIGVVLALKNRKTPVPQKDETPAAPQVQKPEKELEEILKSLLDLNLLIRKDADFPAQLTREIEAVMDDLMIITPAMMDRYPGETLTYEIKKIGKEHLFKTVKEYLDLSADSREHQLDMFKQTIDSLKEVSNRSRDIVEKNETAEFKTMANFLSSKF